MEEFLSKTIGADQAPNLVPLLAQFKEMQKCLTAYLPQGGGGEEPEPPGGETISSVGSTAKPARSSAPGEIVSREDVVKTLDRICDYYARHERSSPVPHVLQRAKRLAQMDFMQIAQDLSPEAVAQLKVIFGEKDEPSS
jgi:type VI secretion system protein ImpA